MIDPIHIDYIRKAFQEMTTRKDLLALLNYAKPIVYKGKSHPFDMHQITYYLKNRSSLNKSSTENGTSQISPVYKDKDIPPIIFLADTSLAYGKKRNDNTDTRYRTFQIEKKSGKMRTINAPGPGLKAIQRTLNFILQCIFEPHTAAMGFVQGKSIVDNARIHTDQKYVYNIDLEDFFPGIEQARVWKCLQLRPFNLIQNDVPGVNVPTSRISILNSFLKSSRIEQLVYVLTKCSKETAELFYYNLFNALQEFNSRTTHFTRNPEFFNAYGTERTPEVLKAEAEEIFQRLFSSLEGVKTDQAFSVYNSLIIIWMTKLIQFREMLKENAAMQHSDPEAEDVQNTLADAIKKIYATNIFKIDPRQEIAGIIASLCCIENPQEDVVKSEAIIYPKNVLPQGAPTSPLFSNVVCQRLDYLLFAVAKRFGLRYSRYADDITFSSMHNVYQKGSDFLIELNRIITEQGFKVNEKKTRLQKEGYRKEVTGLLVNETPNVQLRYIKQLRMWLYYWERYGYNRAYSFFLNQYLADKGNITEGRPNMTYVIRGKLDYLKMVKGQDNEMYLKLRARFTQLLSYEENTNTDIDRLEVVIKNILTFGLELGLKSYYSKK